MPNRMKLAAAVAVLGLSGDGQHRRWPQTGGLWRRLRKPQAEQEARKARGRRPEGARRTRTGTTCWPRSRRPKRYPSRKPSTTSSGSTNCSGIANANLKQYPGGPARTRGVLTTRPACRKRTSPVAHQAADAARLPDEGLPEGHRIRQEGVRADPAIRRSASISATRTTSATTSRTRASVMSDVISKLEASGKTPDEQTYRILQSACLNLKDNDCVVEQIEKLVAALSEAELLGRTSSTRCCASARATRSC